jgi:hypothetical protein
MAFRAGIAARNAENDRTNLPGMCQQTVREWAGIGPLYGTAAIAWANANDRHLNRHVPRGGMAYWTGGSRGAGHVAMGLGPGRHGFAVPIRSSDAGGSGRVATVNLDWIETHWGLHYVGWSWDTNEQTIPHPYWDHHH